MKYLYLPVVFVTTLLIWVQIFNKCCSENHCRGYSLIFFTFSEKHMLGLMLTNNTKTELVKNVVRNMFDAKLQ